MMNGCQSLIILMIVLAAWKFRKLKHAATWMVVGVNLFNLVPELPGRSGAIQQSLKTVVKDDLPAVMLLKLSVLCI